MADFGLAAQIGRGGGGGGMSPQQDPQNRMLQMMQLQQLQQNMMLAREQEGRAAGLYGLQRGTLEETLNNLRSAEDRARQGFVPELKEKEYKALTAGSQSTLAKVGADVAQEGYNVKTRLLKLRSSMAPDVMMSQDFRNTLMRSDPELAIEIDRLVTEGKKTRSEQAKAGYDETTARMAQQKAIVGSIANSLGGVVDQQTFTTVLNELAKVDPLAVELIGPRFDGGSMLKLERRMRGLQNYEIKENAQGNFVRINLDDNTSTIVGSRVLPDVTLNPEGDAATYDAALKLGAAPPPGAVPGTPPIIGQRAPTPEEGLGPKAVAKGQDVTATKSAESTFDAETRKRNAREVLNVTSTPEIDKLISRSTSGGLQRGIAGAYEFVTGQSTKGQEAIGQLETVANKIAFDMAGGKLGAGFSNEDRAFLLKLLGDVGNPDIGANRRVAAFRQFREGLKAIESGKPLSVAPGSATPASIAPEVQSILYKYPPQTRAGS